MFKKLTNMSKAFLFYGIALLLALAVSLMPGTTNFVYMFTPLVAVAIMLFVVTRDGYTKAGLKLLGLHRPGFRAWPAALLVPSLVIGLAYGVVLAVGAADFAVPENPLGLNVPLWTLPLLIILIIVINSLTVSMGEELGWRGYSCRAWSRSAPGVPRS